MPIEPGLGYSFSDLVEITRPMWFFGFVDGNKAKEILLQKPLGSFLIRFSSSNPGVYTLSVNTKDGIGHWRITAHKIARGPPSLKMHGREYRSFYDVVETHSQQPLQSTLDPNMHLTLSIGCDRSIDLK